MKPKDGELWNLVLPAAKDALRKIKETRDSERKVESYPSFPKLKDVDAREFIQLEVDYRVIDFKKVFSNDAKWRSTPHSYSDIAGYAELLDYVLTKPDYMAFHGWGGDPDDKFGPGMVEFGAADIVIEIAARHASVLGFEWDESFALARYVELEAWWQGGTLPVRLYIPILNTSFEQDDIPLSPSVSIRRISPERHVERLFDLRQFERDEWKYRACTHALIVEGLASVEWPRSFGLPQWRDFPYDVIDRAVQAISVESLEPTGYHQVCYEPIGWASGYRGSLGQVAHSFIVNRHSTKLSSTENSPTVILNAEEAARVASNFSGLAAANAQVGLAAKRFQLATLRGDELDEIVDLCVGIEALLGGTQPGETTYKLAVRGAAVLARSREQFDAALTAQLIKKVYSYRSQVVHGQVKYDKKRKIRLGDDEFLATDVAHFLLQRLLAVMIGEPALIDKIDNDAVLYEIIDEWSKLEE